ncbi:transglutaminase domain-containing protein [Ameyamaea chiangmaiensis NBRC 103196]|uniref:Transglutaminase family protein n=1 Tax=Ameyamaea chiangmaiensis TaxID=442969 RepID=A0A850PI42_9PROT|nr:transglutaminase family protein [Ameyamaea chiangmaiensis]MBS4076005.1 transglutaminase family protein [Ameyamaea chiangmaiensis]NVN42070.1 transglutaminase family protein [Ameyamaea chiangmaiensis]GBQ61479.1 transglutaminase domain-containing protein [Ameyamaea chiangmaiensis NBRC 103196]
MLIRAGYDITLTMDGPTPLILMLEVHPDREPDLMTAQVPVFDPPVPVQRYLDGFGNRCTRVLAPGGPLRTSLSFTIGDLGLPDRQQPMAVENSVDTLPSDVLVFLLGSRYCETDLLSDTAWALFGHLTPGWGRVQAVIDFVHQHLRFDYSQARSTRSAFDAYRERVGVCRDFAHLAVTLCRCLNIPARYCTGYLGDIGVPLVPDPMDFSAWLEVWLDGQWYTFDARHNRPRIGRIVMARGRDATDVALTTSFGPAHLTRFEVTTYEEFP